MSLENRPSRQRIILIEAAFRPNRGHPPDGEGRRGTKDGNPFSKKRRPPASPGSNPGSNRTPPLITHRRVNPFGRCRSTETKPHGAAAAGRAAVQNRVNHTVRQILIQSFRRKDWPSRSSLYLESSIRQLRFKLFETGSSRPLPTYAARQRGLGRGAR